MMMNVQLIIRGKKFGIKLKATNNAELSLYTKIADKLLSCKTPEEIDSILCNY